MVFVSLFLNYVIETLIKNQIMKLTILADSHLLKSEDINGTMVNFIFK